MSLAKKSTANQRKEHSVEKYIQWVTALSLTIRRAGLTIRHGTHVRRAPGWKGAPEE